MKLSYESFNMEKVMQWRLILEEYNPKLIHIQASKNIAPDILSRFDIGDTPNPVKNNMKSVNEHNGLEVKDTMKQLCNINRTIKI